MRKKLIYIFLIALAVFVLLNNNQLVEAKKTAAKKAPKVTEEQITELKTNVDNLTRKYYTRELFSPEDSDSLINTKLSIDELMTLSVEPAFAPIYYKLGILFKLRDMPAEAIDALRTVVENFGDTAYAPKAREILLEMGIEIQEPEPVEDEEDEEDYY